MLTAAFSADPVTRSLWTQGPGGHCNPATIWIQLTRWFEIELLVSVVLVLRFWGVSQSELQESWTELNLWLFLMKESLFFLTEPDGCPQWFCTQESALGSQRRLNQVEWEGGHSWLPHISFSIQFSSPLPILLMRNKPENGTEQKPNQNHKTSLINFILWLSNLLVESACVQ